MTRLFVFAFVSAAAAASSFPALTYSTYLRDSFRPKAIAADRTGNIYVAGDAVLDPDSGQTVVLVVKLNPQGTHYLYQRILGGSGNDSANAIAVDAAGTAYVAGAAQSADFPVTSGGHLADAPSGPNGERSFVAKLDADGNVLFSDVLGGSAASYAQAVAVNSAGNVVVSGTSMSAGFPASGGAYNIADTRNHPYLLELDSSGAKVLFSATGIGGSALALDSMGDIYVAGTTVQLDYPTTPGAYQPNFPAFTNCTSPGVCIPQQGFNQYVSKVSPAGSALIWSTAVTGKGNTTNGGLAVDAAGSAYLTGYAAASYPYTVSAPSLPSAFYPGTFSGAPFLTKLDPSGGSLLFSVPAGGAGVAIDAAGHLYAGGGAGLSQNGIYFVPPAIALPDVPPACLPPEQQGSAAPAPLSNVAYVSQVDTATGDVAGTQFIQGSNVTLSGIAVAGTTVWISGPTNAADVPFTAGALTIPNIPIGPAPGAYVGAVQFAQTAPLAGTPQIACIEDAANLAPSGLASRYKLLTIFGNSLGPAMGVGASALTNSLAGDVVSFSASGTYNAPLLYVSSTQINLAVPLIGLTSPLAGFSITVNGVSGATRAIPLTFAYPSVFQSSAGAPAANAIGNVSTALNADGSPNSATHPALLGSVISVFVNGLTPNPDVTNAPLQLESNDGWNVTGIVQSTPFVLQVNLQTPSTLQNDFSCAQGGLCTAAFTLNLGGGMSTGPVEPFSGLSFGGVVYVQRN